MKTLDLSKPITTRDGRSVRILCTDLKRRTGETIAAAITEKDGTDWVTDYSPDGVWHEALGEHANDLINPPTPPKRFRHSAWVNVYPNSLGVHAHDTRADADAAFHKTFPRFIIPRVACVEITVDVAAGEGLV